MCHSIPGYRHPEQVAAQAAAWLVPAGALAAAVSALVQALTVAVVVMGASAVALLVAAIVVVRIVRNYRAVLAWQQTYDPHEAARLAVARAQRRHEAVHVHAERPQAIEPARVYPWAFPWSQQDAQPQHEHVERKST